MTVASDAYDALRAGGFDHRAAVRYLAREFRLDEGTMRRVLSRADRRDPEGVSAPTPGGRAPTVAPPSVKPLTAAGRQPVLTHVSASPVDQRPRRSDRPSRRPTPGGAAHPPQRGNTR